MEMYDSTLSKAITVTAADDDIVEGDETFTIRLTRFEHLTHAPDGAAQSVTAQGVIKDNDKAKVTIGSAAANEGDSMTFTLTLDKAVQGGFTVTPKYSPDTSTRFTPNTTPIAFTGTAGETRTFAVQTIENSTGGEGHAHFSVGLTFSNTSIPDSRLSHGKWGSGTIYDDDDSKLRVAIDGASALEGEDLVFTAYINDVDINPLCGVQLKVVPDYSNGTAEAADYTENTQTLYFGGGLPLVPNTRKTFSVGTAEDSVREGDETFTVGFTVDERDVQPECPDDWVLVGSPATGTILEDDYETVSLSLSPASISEESGTSRVTASLNRASPAATTVTVSAAPASPTTADDFTLSSNTTLTIPVGQTSSSGMVRIRAVGNRTATGDRTITVSGAATNASTVYQPADVTLTLTDNDTAGVTLSRTSLDVVEGGAGSTYTVVLDAQPTAALTVAASVTGDGDIAVNPASVQFGDWDWNVPHTITVTAAADADYDVGTATISHTVTTTDSVWDDVTVADVSVTERDTTYGFVTSIESAEVPEGGSVDYTVRLQTRPTCGTYVRIRRTGDTDLSPNKWSLYFNSGTTSWKTEQTVTLRAKEDADHLSGGATFRHYTTSCDANYKNHEFEMAAVEVDNEAGVLISPVAITPAEGSTATYGVTLQTQPTGDVTVAVAKGSGGDADLTASPASLTFTTSNWDTGQTVTVTAAEDDDGLDGTATFAHTATSSDANYNGVTIPDLAATEGDNDRRVYLPTAVQVTEGGSVEYTASLSTQPSDDVTVKVARLSGDADITVSPSSLTFTAANWSTDQTVTVRAAADVDIVDGTAIIGHTPSGGGWSAAEVGELTVTESDNNRSATTIGGSGNAVSSLTVPEGGSATYQVALGSLPTASVSVAVARKSGDTDITVSPSTLTFTTTNWETAQTVTVSAAEDVDGLNGSAAIGHTVTSNDAGYDGLAIADVTATESDNDAANITLSDTVLTVAEGSGATYTAVLSKAPTDDVTVTISSSGDADLTASPATLTFTTGNWSTAQTVTVSAAADADAEDGTATFTHSASGGGYDNVTATLEAVEADDEPALVPAAVASTSAAVSIENHDSGWWYSVSAGTSVGGSTSAAVWKSSATRLGTCQQSLLETVHLTGLAAGRTYTVTAYGSRGCRAAHRLASVRFTTTGGSGGGSSRPDPGDSGCLASRPSVTNVALASDAGFDDSYAAGDAILIAATFSEPVKPFGTGPTLRFLLGGEARKADHHSGSGTATLNFRYLVAEGDVGALAIPADALAGNRGLIHNLCGLSVVDDLEVEAAALAHRVGGPAQVPLLPPAGDAMGRQGFVRVINHSAEAGEVALTAFDDAGNEHGPVTLAIGAGASKHFNTMDLESGNEAKGLSGGVGMGEGSWRLEVESALDAEAIGYIRHADGFLTAMNSVLPMRDGMPWAATFNPASNNRQASRLRLFNTGDAAADVRIVGIDDAGRSPGGAVSLSLAAGAASVHGAGALESGSGLEGALGDGKGKWRLAVEAPPGIAAMSLMESPSGQLTNLSTAPAHRHGDALVVPLFLSAGDVRMRQGFVRVINRSEEAGTVSIQASDDSAWTYDPVTLSIGAGAAAHFNSDDLELGNAAKGLEGSTGPASAGNWWLALSSDLDIEALAYVRHADGFLTSMHDVAPKRGGVHRVATFNPASNQRQASLLRIVNLGAEPAEVTVKGIDGSGATPEATVKVEVPPGRSLTLDAKTLEEGGDTTEGALGDGASKWRLQITSEQPILVMSLMQSPTGHLTNLSARPMRPD